MMMSRRLKYVLGTLAVYWPLIFVLTHIPVPQIARDSGMSDKTMHGMSYFILTFLVWCALSPFQRARWDGVKPYLVAGVILAYGLFDEFSQTFFGRQFEWSDLASNGFGVMVAMGIVTVFRFWSAMLAVAGISIYVISNLSHLTALYPQFHLNAAFHYGAYAAFTLIWIQNAHYHLGLRASYRLWALVCLSAPLLLLTVVQVAGVWQGKLFFWVDFATAVFGIGCAILASRLSFWLTGKATL